jgi:hypothetical protein
MKKPSAYNSCRAEDVTLYFYGELDAAERQRTDRHLGECAACREELAQLQMMRDSLPKEELHYSPAEIRSFSERIARRLRPQPHPFFRPVLGWSFAAATAVLLLFIMLPHRPEPQLPSPAISLQGGGELNAMPETEMLLNLELLQNLDLLQELVKTEVSG